MRVLITGGAGYVGHRLVPALLKQDYEVIVYDAMYFGHHFAQHDNLRVIQGDIRDTDKLKSYMWNCDAVIHLACMSNDPSFELDEELSRTINYECFEPMVFAAKDVGVKRFINCSTSSVYGISDSPNVTEDHPHVPLTLYNTYKSKCEPILFKHQSKKFVCVNVRPSTICGYSQRMRFDLSVNILTNLAISKGVITVFGGKQKRPNVHIQDMVDCYKLLLTAPDDKVAGETFNVGAKNYTIAHLAKLVKKQVESVFPDKAPIKIEKKPIEDERSYHVNSDKIDKVLGFKPKLTVVDAIDDLCSAFKMDRFPDSMVNEMYYNVKRMRNVFKDLYKDAPKETFDPKKGHMSEIDAPSSWSGQKMIVGFAGMSHLGLVMSGVTATHVDKVICFDEDAELIRDSIVNKNTVPVYEPFLKEHIQDAIETDRLMFTFDPDLVRLCDIVYVTMDVEDHADTKNVDNYTWFLSSFVKRGTPVVILSQVPPGYTRKISELWKDNPVYYQVDNLIFGEAVSRAKFAQRLIIGCYNPKEKIHPSYQKVIDTFGCPYSLISYEEAEVTKIAVNCFLTSSIAMTNTLAELCANVKADWENVARVLKWDKRIGEYAYLKAGLGIGGGHIRRDVDALSEFTFSSFGKDCWQAANAYSNWCHERIESFGDVIKKIAVWGLSYKADTDSITDSPGHRLVRSLMKGDYEIETHDPISSFMPVNEKITHWNLNPLDLLHGCDVLAITTPWNIYKHVDLQLVRKEMESGSPMKVILDPYRVFNPRQALELGFMYETLGLGVGHEPS